MKTVQDLQNEMPNATDDEIADAYKAMVDAKANVRGIAREAGVLRRRERGMVALGEQLQRVTAYQTAMEAWITTGDGKMPVL